MYCFVFGRKGQCEMRTGKREVLSNCIYIHTILTTGASQLDDFAEILAACWTSLVATWLHFHAILTLDASQPDDNAEILEADASL